MTPTPPNRPAPFDRLPDWTGETVVILGGGPSLTPHQVSLVQAAHSAGLCRVLAITSTVLLAPWADWLHAYDAWFWKHSKIADQALQFPGLKTSGQPTPHSLVLQLPMIPRRGGGGSTPFADPTKPIYMGRDSGYQGIQLAALCGAAHILLVGFDARAGTSAERENNRWHNHYSQRSCPDYPEAVKLHRDLAVLLQVRGCRVTNCTPGSAIDAYPTAELAEVLCPAALSA